MKRIVVTGANRGLGLEFVRQYLAEGAHVVAACRRPEQAEALKQLPRATGTLELIALDMGDELSIQSFGNAVAKTCTGVDLLINNAGIFPEEGSFEAVSAQHFMEAFRINTVGPFLVTRALLPLLEKGVAPLVVNMSSGMGSIQRRLDGDLPRNYAYSTSKAALNMVTAALAAELKPKEIAVIAQGPGWVKTDMGGVEAELTPQESVSAMRKTFEKTGMEATGRFQDRSGETMAF